MKRNMLAISVMTLLLFLNGCGSTGGSTGSGDGYSGYKLLEGDISYSCSQRDHYCNLTNISKRKLIMRIENASFITKRNGVNYISRATTKKEGGFTRTYHQTVPFEYKNSAGEYLDEPVFLPPIDPLFLNREKLSLSARKECVPSLEYRNDKGLYIPEDMYGKCTVSILDKDKTVQTVDNFLGFQADGEWGWFSVFQWKNNIRTSFSYLSTGQYLGSSETVGTVDITNSHILNFDLATRKAKLFNRRGEAPLPNPECTYYALSKKHRANLDSLIEKCGDVFNITSSKGALQTAVEYSLIEPYNKQFSGWEILLTAQSNGKHGLIFAYESHVVEFPEFSNRSEAVEFADAFSSSEHIYFEKAKPYWGAYTGVSSFWYKKSKIYVSLSDFTILPKGEWEIDQAGILKGLKAKVETDTPDTFMYYDSNYSRVIPDGSDETLIGYQIKKQTVENTGGAWEEKWDKEYWIGVHKLENDTTQFSVAAPFGRIVSKNTYESISLVNHWVNSNGNIDASFVVGKNGENYDSYYINRNGASPVKLYSAKTVGELKEVFGGIVRKKEQERREEEYRDFQKQQFEAFAKYGAAGKLTDSQIKYQLKQCKKAGVGGCSGLTKEVERIAEEDREAASKEWAGLLSSGAYERNRAQNDTGFSGFQRIRSQVQLRSIKANTRRLNEYYGR